MCVDGLGMDEHLGEMGLLLIYVRKSWIEVGCTREGWVKVLTIKSKETPGSVHPLSTFRRCIHEDMLFRRNVRPRMGGDARGRQDFTGQSLENEFDL